MTPSNPAVALLAMLRERASMFSGRFSSAEEHPEKEDKLAALSDEFIRFLANVAERHGPEYAAYALNRLVTGNYAEHSGGRITSLMLAFRKIVHATEGHEKEKRLLDFLKKTLVRQ